MKWTQVLPTSYPITYSDVAWIARIDDPDERTHVNDLIAAVTEYAETAMGASLLTRTVTAKFYCGDKLFLPRGPILSGITSVVDGDNNTIDPSNYELRGYGNGDYLHFHTGLQAFGFYDFILSDFIDLGQWKYKSPLTVTYQAGYGSAASNVPADIRQALKMHAASLYRNREGFSNGSINNVPHSLDAFYRAKSRQTGIG